MNSVRMWYEKSGLAVYTSHLDMNRCFTRAVRRADIPLWYTEGFNPHPYMTFLLPLPLGQAGVREPVDIRTESEISNEEILSRMNSVLPEGLRIVDVTEPVDKVNTIKYLPWSEKVNRISRNVKRSKLKSALEKRIRNGEYPFGSRFPGLKDLIREYDASYVTVNKAVKLLADEGYLRYRPGIGYLHLPYMERHSL